ncbi:hypothetical protein DFH09DRAFT_826888, partial [Mycena vulgaris]
VPTELEREIFECVALSHPRSIPKLLLVARRVKIWQVLEPLLYRVLYVTHFDPTLPTPRKRPKKRLRITEDACLQLIRVKLAPFLRDHVRHLALETTKITTTDRMHILSTCSGTVNLALPMDAAPAFLPSIAAMPLVRFSADLEKLFGSRDIDFGHPIFDRLSHLDIFESDLLDTWPVGLGQIPYLTHLSITMDLPEPSLLQDALNHCKRLQALAVVF